MTAPQPQPAAIDRVLAVGAMFDGITPVAAFVLCSFCGYTHFCAYDNGGAEWAGLHYVLRERGIKSRWPQILGSDQYHVNVPKAQARYAMYVMDQLHLNYTHSPIPRRHRPAKPAPAKRSGWAARIKSELFN